MQVLKTNMNKEKCLIWWVLMFSVYELIICVTQCAAGSEPAVSGNK